MAIIHADAVRNSIADLVVDLLDGGSLEFQTSAGDAVAVLDFGTPAFGAAASGTAAANAITSDTNAAGGTVAQFVLKDGTGNVELSGSAGDAGTEDIVLSSATVGAGDTLSADSLSYSAPA